MDTHPIAGPGRKNAAERGSIGTLDDCTTVITQHDLDDHVAALIAANPGIGAVLIDRAGHVKLLTPTAAAGNSMFALAPGVYASIQSAIDAAADGDAIYVVAGTYREQLTIRGKELDLFGATSADGSLLVTIESPATINLDIDATNDSELLTGECAVIRIRDNAHVTMRHLIIDGRNQGTLLQRSGPRYDFTAISATGCETIVEHVETQGFGAVRWRGTDVPKSDVAEEAELVEGNVGVDQAVFTGVRATYDITCTCKTVTVASAEDGSHTLDNIEVLSFLDTIIDLRAAVRLLDGHGHLKATYTTIQAAVNAAAGGDKIVVAAGEYREDLYIDECITLSGATEDPESTQPGAEALIIGRVVVGVHGVGVVVDGVAIEGSLEMKSVAGTTAAITLRNTRIDASGEPAAICASPPHLQMAVQQRLSWVA